MSNKEMIHEIYSELQNKLEDVILIKEFQEMFLEDVLEFIKNYDN
tara:strand:- start:337 stop:471 length:135 start_codon:yes stop_codon:yes gene_type:complete